MEQKVKAGDYVILDNPLNNGECVKVVEKCGGMQVNEKKDVPVSAENVNNLTLKNDRL